MTGAILIVIFVILLKGFSSIGEWALTVSQIISIPLGIWLFASILADIIKNIPKTLTSSIHPNRDPNAEEPGELYKELWAQQKKKYLGFIVASVVLRGIAVFLLLNWFYLI